MPSARIWHGLALIGIEVKSIKSGKVNLLGSHVTIKNGELFLVGATIPPYQPASTPADYKPERDRKLLVKKEEIKYLFGKIQEKGLTLVPIRVYNSKAKLKLEFGIGKGRRKEDKREKIRKREADREMNRALKRGHASL